MQNRNTEMVDGLCERCYHWEQFGGGRGYCWVRRLPTNAKDTCALSTDRVKRQGMDISVPNYHVEDYRIPGEKESVTRLQLR